MGAGVIYLSRVPPFLGPGELRAKLDRVGEVTRVFLKPEANDARRKRVKAGGRRNKNFTCGWVEFASRRHAETAAVLLNARPIGGKKKSLYHDDLWNIKFLDGFAWNDLTEQMAFQRRTREQRVALEVSQARRERDFYLEKVDQAKAIDSMTERATNKRVKSGQQPDNPKRVRHFRQRSVANDEPAPKNQPSTNHTNPERTADNPKQISDDLLQLIFPK